MMLLPGMAAPPSTPAGSLRRQVVEEYANPTLCLAALNEWAQSLRDEERDDPTHAPSTWQLDGPQQHGKSIGYRLTRVSVMDLSVIRRTVASIYARSCDGRVMTIVSDGWVSEDFLPPPPP